MNSHYGPNHYQRRQHETVYTQSPGHPPYHQHYNVPYHHMPPQYHQTPQYYQHPLQSPTQQYPYPPMGVPQYPVITSPSMHRPPYHPYTSPPNASTRPQMLSPPMPPTRLPQTPSSVARSRPSPPPAPPLQAHHQVFARRMPYYPPLPWYSVAKSNFPPRDPRKRRRRPRPPLTSDAHLELPTRGTEPAIEEQPLQDVDEPLEPLHAEIPVAEPTPEPTPPESGEAPSALVESTSSFTPATSEAPSEADSTQPTTPSSAIAPPPRLSAVSGIKAADSPIKRRGPVIPAVPNIPSLRKPAKPRSVSVVTDSTKHAKSTTNEDNINGALVEASRTELARIEDEATSQSPEEMQTPSLVETKVAPKSWADLVRTKAPINAASLAAADGKNPLSNGFGNGQAIGLAEALTAFDLAHAIADTRVSFLKPRGLVNTGNMCYMNSVLQVLVSCVPFYAFLGEVARQAVHSFNSQTPMLDAMIMFMREFPVIDSATSVDQLRMRLQQNELEQYGDAFTPDFVYEVIRRLPRFSTMRRGHQQDAEEFLGFLLEELHDECSRVMRSPPPDAASPEVSSMDGLRSPDSESHTEDSGWLEVGPKQKAAITRSSGVISKESPITKVFGGKLRSELRVPGAKNSVTQESYQALQLDIGSSSVNNILDALKGLTRSETLHGDFNSPRGPGTPATKQVFIETLPPVLILHLKRFQYDNTGGTQKIWKKIGYPLDLEIPKEVFPLHKRGGLVAHNGLPKYQLISVVYHHGKNASGGHYTVDVRRQDGREWIRLDDTVIRRLRTEEVAEGGSEEDPKVLAAALEQHKRDQSTSRSNIFDQVREEEEEKETAEQGWSQVNGGGNLAPGTNGQGKKWSGIVNGASTPASDGKKTPVARSSNREGKVAYLLFYQRVGL